MRKITWPYWLALAVMLVALAGCTSNPMTITTPMMVPGPGGAMVPVLGADDKPIMQTYTVPEGAIPYWAQVQMANNRRPYFSQELDESGKVKSQTMWGENGRAEVKEIDSDTVKIIRAVAGPGGAVAVAGISGYFGWQNNQALWNGLGNIMNRPQSPSTVNVSGNSNYNTGQVGTGTWSFSPVTTTTDNHAITGQ